MRPTGLGRVRRVLGVVGPDVVRGVRWRVQRAGPELAPTGGSGPGGGWNRVGGIPTRGGATELMTTWWTATLW
jgi:hypothetical protein